jgi:hypothetical protein
MSAEPASDDAKILAKILYALYWHLRASNVSFLVSRPRSSTYMGLTQIRFFRLISLSLRGVKILGCVALGAFLWGRRYAPVGGDVLGKK